MHSIPEQLDDHIESRGDKMDVHMVMLVIQGKYPALAERHLLKKLSWRALIDDLHLKANLEDIQMAAVNARKR